MTEFSIPDMSCGHCKATITQTLTALDPNVALDFDMGARRMTVRSTSEVSAMRDALKAVGYEATPV